MSTQTHTHKSESEIKGIEEPLPDTFRLWSLQLVSVSVFEQFMVAASSYLFIRREYSYNVDIFLREIFFRINSFQYFIFIFNRRDGKPSINSLQQKFDGDDGEKKKSDRNAGRGNIKKS